MFELALIVTMISMVVCGPVAAYLVYKDMDKWCHKEKRDTRFDSDTKYSKLFYAK